MELAEAKREQMMRKIEVHDLPFISTASLNPPQEDRLNLRSLESCGLMVDDGPSPPMLECAPTGSSCDDGVAFGDGPALDLHCAPPPPPPVATNAPAPRLPAMTSPVGSKEPPAKGEQPKPKEELEKDLVGPVQSSGVFTIRNSLSRVSMC